MEVDKSMVKMGPIWVKLPGLPFKCWGEKSLFKIVGQMGKAIKMNDATKAKNRLSYARVMVEVAIQNQHPELVQFCNEHGNIVDQKLEYEWKPVQCGKCLGFGHDNEHCRKLEGKKKWVKKNVTYQEGFIRVATHKVGPVNTTVEIPVHNPFMVLEDQGMEGMAEQVTGDVSDADGVGRNEVVGLHEIGGSSEEGKQVEGGEAVQMEKRVAPSILHG